MIDQERQLPKKFHQKLHQYEVTLQIISETNSLLIDVDESLSLARYSLVIDQQFVDGNQQFKNIIDDPQDIYTQLLGCFDEIVLQNGFLKFNCVYGIKKKQKMIALPLRKEEDTMKIALTKFQRMKQSILQKEDQIVKLKQRLAKSQLQKKDLKQALQRKKDKSKELSNNAQIQSIQISELLASFKVAQKANKQSLKKSEQAVAKLKQNLKSQREKNKALQEQLEQYQIIFDIKPKNKLQPQIHINQNPKNTSQNPIYLNNHLTNAHRFYYAVNPLDNNIMRVILTGQTGNWYNFVNRYQISPNEKARYLVKMTDVKQNVLIVGFCSEKGLSNLRNYLHPESAYFNCRHPGFVWQGGSGKQINCTTAVGDVIQCCADLPNNIIFWCKNGIRIAQCNVPTQMKYKPIYLSLILLNQGDYVDVNM